MVTPIGIMRLRYFVLFIFCSLVAAAQELPTTVADTTFYSKVDSLYREDQFYLRITYNLVRQTPDGYSQNGVSPGFGGGFLRDFPLNKKRTFAVAAGMGISYNKYHHDLQVSEFDGIRNYVILQDVNYDRNKLEQVLLEFPLEIRFRNSTPESHKFWRFYAGVKASYLVFSKTKFVGNETVTVINNPDFRKWQFGPYLSAGYNTWNFYAYYGAQPLFRNASIDGKRIDLTTLNLGLMFYIL
ncbi:porin family protein [Flavobacterium sp.]|uniref:porin family protein n=1 Tax=Flavobacterium sp. TaxID=239 RepID=UPI003B9B5ADC